PRLSSARILPSAHLLLDHTSRRQRRILPTRVSPVSTDDLPVLSEAGKRLHRSTDLFHSTESKQRLHTLVHQSAKTRRCHSEISLRAEYSSRRPMNDGEFHRLFHDGNLPTEEFGHRCHLRLASLILSHHGKDDAERIVAREIQKFA